jgi:hypothetical protein
MAGLPRDGDRESMRHIAYRGTLEELQTFVRISLHMDAIFRRTLREHL